MSQFGIAWGEWVWASAHGGFGRGTAAAGAATTPAAAVLAAVAALGIGAQQADAALIAAWNLNNLDPASGAIVSASTGIGTLDCTGLGTGVGLMQGTTLGAQPGEVAGNALAVVGNAYNQASLRLEVATDGFTDLGLSFATRRSSTGFAMNRIEYWSGLGWSTLANFGSNPTAWEVQTYSLASLDAVGGGFLTLRIVIDGATGSTGSIRFDNFAVTGTAVPAPAGAVALLGLAGLVARRRR